MTHVAPALCRFGARCPRGHYSVQNGSVADLSSAEHQFCCALCLLAWPPTEDERARARAFVEAAPLDDQRQSSSLIVIIRLACERCAADVDIHCQPAAAVDSTAISLVECPECGHGTDAVLPGPILDVFLG